MTSQSTLGPFTTLILSLAFSEKATASITQPAGVTTSFLFASFLTDILSTRARRNAGLRPRVFRIGNEREFDTAW
jgi:hypothetical protein